MKHGSLFSGIGGFDLAAQLMGWENVFHCEWNPFGQKILKYYWPNATSYEDITKTDFTIHRGKIDILTGGFPCQPYSLAGQRKGKEDERHLWPEMLRAIREIKPRWVVGENVLGLVGWNDGMVFEEVQADLEAEGYEVQPYVLPAASVGAPHRRDRVWFVAYANSHGRSEDTERQARSDGQNRHEYEHVCISEVAAYSNGCSTRSPGKSGEFESYRSNNYDEQESGGSKTEFDSGCRELLRDVADSNSGIRRTVCGHETCVGRKNKKHSVNSNVSSNEHASHAKRIGQQGSGRTREPMHPKEDGNWKTSWSDDDDNWPTQSPVCNGDDGFSSRLDGITFSKWRTESIKGGGNAIVPQVVLQIFKAIEQYENQHRDIL